MAKLSDADKKRLSAMRDQLMFRDDKAMDVVVALVKLNATVKGYLDGLTDEQCVENAAIAKMTEQSTEANTALAVLKEQDTVDKLRPFVATIAETISQVIGDMLKRQGGGGQSAPASAASSDAMDPEEARDKYPDIVKQGYIKAVINEAQCRSCSAPVVWCETMRGKRMPMDLAGTSHFKTCPDAEQHRQ